MDSFYWLTPPALTGEGHTLFLSGEYMRKRKTLLFPPSSHLFREVKSMAIRTTIKLTGTAAFIVAVLWLFLQFYMTTTDPMLSIGSGAAFIVLVVVLVFDAARGGLSD